VYGEEEIQPVAYRGIVFGREGPANSVEDRRQREWGSGGCSPLVEGSGGSCNLVQEISFHVAEISFFGRASNLYLCLYNQLFALYHYVF